MEWWATEMIWKRKGSMSSRNLKFDEFIEVDAVLLTIFPAFFQNARDRAENLAIGSDTHVMKGDRHQFCSDENGAPIVDDAGRVFQGLIGRL